MGLFGSKIECALCNTSFLKKEGKIFMDDGKGGVCRICFEKWVSEGAQCAICHQAVPGSQEVGFFPQKKSLGHYDCGSGMRLR
jgi:hypothetical protein